MKKKQVIKLGTKFNWVTSLFWKVVFLFIYLLFFVLTFFFLKYSMSFQSLSVYNLNDFSFSIILHICFWNDCKINIYIFLSSATESKLISINWKKEIHTYTEIWIWKSLANMNETELKWESKLTHFMYTIFRPFSSFVYLRR